MIWQFTILIYVDGSFGCEAKEVYAKGAVVRYPELGEIGDIDHASISIEFTNGKLAILEVSRNANYGYDIRTDIICENGAAFVGHFKRPAVILLQIQCVITQFLVFR